MPRYGQCPEQIIHRIVAKLRQRDLCARYDLIGSTMRQWSRSAGKERDTHHSLTQVLQEKAQCGRRVRHGVRPVQDHKRVKGRVIELNLRSYAYPICTVRVLLLAVAQTRGRGASTVPAISMLLLSKRGCHFMIT